MNGEDLGDADDEEYVHQIGDCGEEILRAGNMREWIEEERGDKTESCRIERLECRLKSVD